MADGKGESREGLANGDIPSPARSASRGCRLSDTLRALEDGLRENEVSVLASSDYCRRFCEVSGGIPGLLCIYLCAATRRCVVIVPYFGR